MIFSRFFSRKTAPNQASGVYDVIVAQARQPWFYQHCAVPDTVEGRFDMIVLHAFLLFDRLQGHSGETGAFSQQVFDVLFADMDRSLREMGVGDLAVGKKIRKMAEMFYGRADAYSRALEQGGDELQASIARNIFPDGAPAGHIAALACYTRRARNALAGIAVAEIINGQLVFVPPEPPAGNKDPM